MDNETKEYIDKKLSLLWIRISGGLGVVVALLCAVFALRALDNHDTAFAVVMAVLFISSGVFSMFALNIVPKKLKGVSL